MADDDDLARFMPKLPDYSALLKVPDYSALRNPAHDIIQANLASQFRERLAKWITEFDATLDQEHEVGVRLVTFGQTVVFHLESLGYSNPSLILFRGHLEDGSPVELIQHVSQISVLLMKLPREDPSKPKQPVGFCAPTPEPVDEP
jgi:hypothetical protein